MSKRPHHLKMTVLLLVACPFSFDPLPSKLALNKSAIDCSCVFVTLQQTWRFSCSKLGGLLRQSFAAGNFPAAKFCCSKLGGLLQAKFCCSKLSCSKLLLQANFAAAELLLQAKVCCRKACSKLGGLLQAKVCCSKLFCSKLFCSKLCDPLSFSSL